MLELGVLSFRQQKYEEAGRLLERARTVYSKLRQIHPSEYSAGKAALASDYLAAVKLFQVDAEENLPEVIKTQEIAKAVIK